MWQMEAENTIQGKRSVRRGKGMVNQSNAFKELVKHYPNRITVEWDVCFAGHSSEPLEARWAMTPLLNISMCGCSLNQDPVLCVC